MDAQTIIVLLVIAAALAYTARRAWRKVSSSLSNSTTDCGSGCGKCAANSKVKANFN